MQSVDNQWIAFYLLNKNYKFIGQNISVVIIFVLFALFRVYFRNKKISRVAVFEGFLGEAHQSVKSKNLCLSV